MSSNEKDSHASKAAIKIIHAVEDGTGRTVDVSVPYRKGMPELPRELSLDKAIEVGIPLPDDFRRKPAITSIITVCDGKQEYEMEIPVWSDSQELPQQMSVDEAKKMGIVLSDFPKMPANHSLAYLSTMGQDCKAEKLQTGSKKDNPEIASKFQQKEIYFGNPEKKKDFLKEPAKETIGLGVEIYHRLVKVIRILVYEENYYVFQEDAGIYVKYTASELDRLINQFYGAEIERKDDLEAYAIARQCLLRDYRLDVREELLPPSRFWFFRNLVVDTMTKEVQRNQGQFFIRSVLDCAYDSEATCPQFDAFLTSVSGGDGALKELLWECTGYLLSRDTGAKVFFACIGKKDTGKSLFAKVLSGIIGDSGLAFLSASDFAGRFDLVDLNGKRLNVCMDLPDKPLTPEAVGKIKALTGNDVIRSDVKFKRSIRFRPTARLLFGSNHKIRTVSYDKAFEDRLIMIPFNYPVPKERQDFMLEQKLLSEASGICVQAMRHYVKLVQNDYKFTVVDWTDDDEFEIDYNKVVAEFTKRNCVITGNSQDRLSSSDLYHVFCDFCLEMTIETLELKDFSRIFRTLYGTQITKKRVRINGGDPVQGFIGIRFRKAEEQQ